MSSKYTRRTGDGYQSIHSTGSGKATVSLGTVDHVDWELGEAIAALAHPDAILLKPLATVAPEADRLGVYDVCHQGHGLNVTVGGPALRSIGMPDEVRVYAHAENALLVVDADDDPRIMTDGGRRGMRHQIDAQEHYKQKSQKHEEKALLLFGLLSGLVAGLLWEAIRR